jgi:glycosyltransferase involved in cell wall biosynthesis
MSGKRIVYLTSSGGACSWYRCYAPASALRRKGHEVFITKDEKLPEIAECDVLVVQLKLGREVYELVKWAKHTGKTVVYEMDDDYWHVDRSNPAYRIWGQPNMLRALEELLRMVDLVTVTTDSLARSVKPLNKNVFVLPNMLPPDHWPEGPNDVSSHRPVRIGWAGSQTHYVDLKIVQPALEQVLEQRDDVEVLIGGGGENSPLADHPHIRFLSMVKLDKYPAMIEQFDIGVTPLWDSRFNRAKSDLKFVEYARVGVPTIVSDVEPYSKTVRHGETGFIAKNDKDWLKYLKRLAENPDLRAEIGANARAYAETRMIDANIDRWERAYGID